jgi:hypothetical protein
MEEVVCKIPPTRLQALDDTSLAFKFGVHTRKLWFAIIANDYTRNLEGSGMYKVFKLKKKSGGYRTIHDPCVFMKRLQHRILVDVLDPLSVPPHVGAYVKGRGLEHTSSQHVDAALLIHMDITDFFNSTRKKWVQELFTDIGYNDNVAGLLTSLVTVPILLKNGHKVRGVPQGACTSGAVCNHVAIKRIDTPILEYLDSLPETWVYTRYADDLCISTKGTVDESAVRDVKAVLADLIRASGYSTNKKKTRHIRSSHPHKSMRVLGHSVHTHVNIPTPVYRRLRAVIHNCTKLGVETQVTQYGAKNSEELLTRLLGEVSYWRHVCPTSKIESLYQSLLSLLRKASGLVP